MEWRQYDAKYQALIREYLLSCLMTDRHPEQQN